jgi:acyl-CoA synthetase (AMP-forming)/AMP-acid ligase II
VTELLDYCVAAGLPAQALASSYGLAESVAGVATSLRGDGLHLDELRDSSGASHQFVSSGPTLRDTSVRIVADGRSVGDGEIGEIEVAGPCLMSGYLDPAIDSPIRHGWLNTGDLGYLRDGEVYVTGRIKDMVIVMGHNYYPDDLEWAASRVPGIRPGRCVAFSDGERAVLLVEAREDAAGLATQVRHAVADAVGLGRVEVNVVPRDTVEKTTSGKLRRSTMKELYRTGGLTIESTSG